jgi:hypothetical protein
LLTDFEHIFLYLFFSKKIKISEKNVVKKKRRKNVNTYNVYDKNAHEYKNYVTVLNNNTFFF